MLEDVCLHESASVVVWLTSAVSKGYLLQEKHVAWSMGLVRVLCLEPCRFYQQYIGFEHYEVQSLLHSIDNNVPHSDLIYSCPFRFSYGGMRPDLDFFYYYALILLERNCVIFLTNLLFPPRCLQLNHYKSKTF